MCTLRTVLLHALEPPILIYWTAMHSFFYDDFQVLCSHCRRIRSSLNVNAVLPGYNLYWVWYNLVHTKDHIEKFLAEKPDEFWTDGIFKLRGRCRKLVEKNGTYIINKCITFKFIEAFLRYRT